MMRNHQEQKASEEFHMMVGYCIAEWAKVDDALFAVFQDCMQAPIPQCAIVYYRTPGLDVRLKLVDEIVKCVLLAKPKQSGAHDPDEVKKWRAAWSACDGLLSTRRRIAHHPVRATHAMKPISMADKIAAMDPYYHPPQFFFLNQQGGTAQALQASFEIYVSQSEQARGKSEAPEPLTVTDLQEHLQAVTKAHSNLSAYHRDVLAPALALSRRGAPPQSGQD